MKSRVDLAFEEITSYNEQAILSHRNLESGIGVRTVDHACASDSEMQCG